ncbi:FAD-dependent oxidoreductase [Streptomyces sp. NPDC127172]|uniref:FAD-dependent oxidoreductase n=1 Tax=Streptomyces sp. NPDC127172 TaxID=3345382 RepID=UPI003635F711
MEFTPALPEAVAGPIPRLGMGVFNKVFLQFADRFWRTTSTRSGSTAGPASLGIPGTTSPP